jgi:formyltetrahydrofolate hydrolase
VRRRIGGPTERCVKLGGTTARYVTENLDEGSISERTWCAWITAKALMT